MKIIFISEDIENDISAYNLITLSVYLTKKGHKITVMCREDSHIYSECQKNKIETLKIGLIERIGLLKIPKADIIDIFNFSPFANLIIKRLSKTPVLLRQFNFLTEAEYEKIAKIQDSVYKILPACDSLKKTMISKHIDEKKLFTFLPVLNMTRWESAKLIKSAMFLKRPYKIGMVYRIIKHEKVELFLNIAKEVISEIENVNFAIIGPKYDFARQKARELNISHKIDMLDWRTDMPEVMAMLHIFLNVDIKPDISRSLIEAMASGVVCVAPKIEGFVDFIDSDHNGILVEAGNIKEYKNIIKNLLNDPPRCQTISTISYQYVNNNMSADILSRLSEIVYEEAINS
jgi:glycosyltransferase involved in cell wall biosynthesis